MQSIYETIGKTWLHIKNDSLYRNSIFLLLSSLVNAGFGFIFWIICARIFSQQHVGIATATIAAAGLISGLGTLGFNNAIIRFLPNHTNRNQLLNSVFTAVIAACTLATVIFMLVVPYLTPSLEYLLHNWLYAFIFFIAVISYALNIIVDNIFTALRATQYTFIKNSTVNVVRIILLAPFFQLAGLGIVAAYGFAFLIITTLSIITLVKRFDYKFAFMLKKDVLRSMAKFSFANYLVSYINGFPALFLPIVITSLLGANINAVYYIAYTVASLLFFIPLGISNALFAEGTHNETEFKNLIKKAMRFNLSLMIPGVVFMLILAPVAISFFGQQYAPEGTTALRIVALSAIFLAISYPCGSILNVKHRLRSLIIVNILGAACVVGFVYIAILQGYGLYGVATAWVLGQAFYALFYLVAALRSFDITLSTILRRRGAKAS